MKYLLIIVSVFVLTGCDYEERLRDCKEEAQKRAIIIDDCEYLSNITYGNFFIYTHKGNCKNCEKRLKETIREVIKEELKNKTKK